MIRLEELNREVESVRNSLRQLRKESPDTAAAQMQNEKLRAIEDALDRLIDASQNLLKLIGNQPPVDSPAEPESCGHAHDQMLLAEIEHRVKNNMSAIMSIADHTIAGARSLDDFRESFMGRLLALARMHAMLSQSKTRGAFLHDLIEAALQPYFGKNHRPLIMSGPPLRLTARTAQCLGMAFHELATNAAKYGALSVEEGIVHVQWRLSDDRTTLHLQWQEAEGPPVSPPTRRGFGSELIVRCVAYDLHGESSMTFDPTGVCCDIRVPWKESIGVEERPDQSTVVAESAANSKPANPASSSATRNLRGLRVLIVEDSHLVSAEVQRMLMHIGCTPIGTAQTTANGLEMIDQHACDLVLLDIQLNGEDIWPLADELLRRQIPFILTTGYSCPSALPPEYRHCRYLEKPYDRRDLEGKMREAIAQGLVQPVKQ